MFLYGNITSAYFLQSATLTVMHPDVTPPIVVHFNLCEYHEVWDCLCCFTEADMTIDEKYKKTLEEIEALKDHLGTTICQFFHCLLFFKLFIE